MSIRLLRHLLAGVLIVSVCGCGENDDVAGPSGPSGPTRLTHAPESDFRPEWSPDESRIAFVSYRSGEAEIWAQAVDGGDGSQILFQSNGEIWVISSEGGSETCLTLAFEPDATFPQWSPGGQKIAFLSGGGGGGLWILPSGGGEAVQLTDQYVSGGFDWSPAGDEIAFGSGPFLDQDIWIVPTAGGDAVRLTEEPGIDWAPSWSPDGSTIAYAASHGETIHYDLWTMSTTGEGAVARTSDSGSDQSLAWSPDGTRIAFQSDRSGNLDVWLLDLSR